VRFRADYQLMQYVSVYGGLTYEDWKSDDRSQEFDRFLGTVGLSFRY
jgi:ABC-type molybdate transport system ATPase subunit